MNNTTNPMIWAWLSRDGRVRSASNEAPTADPLMSANADGDRIVSYRPAPQEAAEPVGGSICRICDGGPGNYGVCLCGAHAYETPLPSAAPTDNTSLVRAACTFASVSWTLSPDQVLRLWRQVNKNIAALASRPAAPKADPDVMAALKKVHSALLHEREDAVFKSGVRIGNLKRIIEAALTNPANNRSAGEDV